MDLFVAHHHAPSEAVDLLGSASIAETGEAEQGHEDLDGSVDGEQDEGNGAAERCGSAWTARLSTAVLRVARRELGATKPIAGAVSRAQRTASCYLA